jgi:hypothetical protein
MAVWRQLRGRWRPHGGASDRPSAAKTGWRSVRNVSPAVGALHESHASESLPRLRPKRLVARRATAFRKSAPDLAQAVEEVRHVAAEDATAPQPPQVRRTLLVGRA